MQFRKKHTVIHSSEIDLLPPREAYLALSLAYADAAIVLCRALCAGDLGSSYADACPMVNLAYHATELFYKGCLLGDEGCLSKQHGGANGHNLLFLQEEFASAFPDEALSFEPPHEVLLLGEGWDGPQLAMAHQSAKPLEQWYRYPADAKGNRFGRADGVVPEDMLDHLLRSREQMGTIAQRLLAPTAAG